MSTTRERELAVLSAARAWVRAKGDRRRDLAEQLAEATRLLDAPPPARPLSLIDAVALDEEQRVRAIQRRLDEHLVEANREEAP